MRETIDKQKLSNMTDEKLRELIKGRVIQIHMYNGRMTNVGVNDLIGFNPEKKVFYTYSGVEIVSTCTVEMPSQLAIR